MSENDDAGETGGNPPSPRSGEPDAHGQAALLLAESIVHALIESGNLTLGQAIDVVRTAAEVKAEVAEETHESKGRMRQSLALLGRIERSLISEDSQI